MGLLEPNCCVRRGVHIHCVFHVAQLFGEEGPWNLASIASPLCLAWRLLYARAAVIHSYCPYITQQFLQTKQTWLGNKLNKFCLFVFYLMSVSQTIAIYTPTIGCCHQEKFLNKNCDKDYDSIKTKKVSWSDVSYIAQRLRTAISDRPY